MPDGESEIPAALSAQRDHRRIFVSVEVVRNRRASGDAIRRLWHEAECAATSRQR